jgi:chitinase
MLFSAVNAGCVGVASDAFDGLHTQDSGAASDSGDDAGTAVPDGGNENDSGQSDPFDAGFDAGEPDSGMTHSRDAAGPWVVGYYVGYQYQMYPPAEVDYGSLTHITVGRVRPTNTGGLITDFDIGPLGPSIAKDLAKRAKMAGTVPLLMVGGAGEHAGWQGAASAANRAAFVTRLLKALDDYGYAGLDLDWEPIDAQDEAPLLALVDELKAARPGIVLTVPVLWLNANSASVPGFFAQLAQKVDRLNMMSYGMADGWSGWLSWHSSALKGEGPTTPTSVTSTLNAFLSVGVPSKKMGVGIGFYGSCWASPVTGPRQPTNGAAIKAGDNVMTYAAIMDSYYEPAASHYDTDAEASYLSFSAPKGPQGCTFISYEDERSVVAKGQMVIDRELGGEIIWTINEGYWPNAPNGDKHRLLRAAYRALYP